MPICCPVCLKEMQSFTFKDVELDHCRLCGGMWFDGGEMEKIAAQKDIPRRITEPIAYDFSQRKVEEGNRSCPRCSMAMKVMQFKDVSVDVCTKCQGIWFDRYEVAKVLGRDKGLPEKAFHYQDFEKHKAEMERLGPASDAVLPSGTAFGGALGEAFIDALFGHGGLFH